MTKILVTGANGQLGRCILDASSQFPQYEITYATKADLDLSSIDSMEAFFRNSNFDYCINTAAYTNVEEAESNRELAFRINAEGVKALGDLCKKNETILLHISTDYVFDGTKTASYLETDPTNPINVYGASKLKGEQLLDELDVKCFIIRTSWLYSQYGHNFFNTINKHVRLGTDLKITTQQTGTPTNANDLANVVFRIINAESTEYGLYHFSNNGAATWYDFAVAIVQNTRELRGAKIGKTNDYRTFAERPEYSVLDKTKIERTFAIPIEDWEESLQHLISTINQIK